MNDQTTTAWWSLRIAFFLGLFLSGLDKFFHLLTNWDQYLSPIAQRALGSHSHQFMLGAGVAEMLVAVMIIRSWTRLGGYLASIWLLLNAINIAMTGQFLDVALRDLGLCLCAFGLAKLTEVGEQQVLHIVPTEMRGAA